MKKNMILLLFIISTFKVVNAQSIPYKDTFKTMKDFTSASVKMMGNHTDGVIAKNVKVFYGKDVAEIEYYTFVYDFSTKSPYYCVLDTSLMDFCKIDKKNLYEVNVGTRELTHYKNSDFRNFKPMKGTLEAQHKIIEYYIYGNENIKPEVNYALYKKTDTIIRTKPCLIFYASNFNNKYRKDAIYYIDKANYELDSVIWVGTGKDGKRYVSKKEIVTDVENFNMNEISDLFNFENPQYTEFSRHDGKNEPYSFAYSDNENFSIPKVTSFELQDLNNRKTSIQNEKGWVLLDIWEFGCKGCYAGFKRMGQQIDSIGQTVLERNGVKVICVNPLSDNMELIAKVAEKYNVHNLLYAGKGLTALISIPSYPTYYLLSPENKVVKKGTQFSDEEILDAIRQYKH